MQEEGGGGAIVRKDSKLRTSDATTGSAEPGRVRNTAVMTPPEPDIAYLPDTAKWRVGDVVCLRWKDAGDEDQSDWVLWRGHVTRPSTRRGAARVTCTDEFSEGRWQPIPEGEFHITVPDDEVVYAPVDAHDTMAPERNDGTPGVVQSPSRVRAESPASPARPVQGAAQELQVEQEPPQAVRQHQPYAGHDIRDVLIQSQAETNDEDDEDLLDALEEADEDLAENISGRWTGTTRVHHPARTGRTIEGAPSSSPGNCLAGADAKHTSEPSAPSPLHHDSTTAGTRFADCGGCTDSIRHGATFEAVEGHDVCTQARIDPGSAARRPSPLRGGISPVRPGPDLESGMPVRSEVGGRRGSRTSGASDDGRPTRGDNKEDLRCTRRSMVATPCPAHHCLPYSPATFMPDEDERGRRDLPAGGRRAPAVSGYAENKDECNPRRVPSPHNMPSKVGTHLEGVVRHSEEVRSNIRSFSEAAAEDNQAGVRAKVTEERRRSRAGSEWPNKRPTDGVYGTRHRTKSTEVHRERGCQPTNDDAAAGTGGIYSGTSGRYCPSPTRANSHVVAHGIDAPKLTEIIPGLKKGLKPILKAKDVVGTLRWEKLEALQMQEETRLELKEARRWTEYSDIYTAIEKHVGELEHGKWRIPEDYLHILRSHRKIEPGRSVAQCNTFVVDEFKVGADNEMIWYQRPIVEPLVNRIVDKLKLDVSVSFDDRTTTRMVLAHARYVVEFDVTACFDQIPIHENIRHFFGTNANETLTCLSMGYKASVKVAKGVVSALLPEEIPRSNQKLANEGGNTPQIRALTRVDNVVFAGIEAEALMQTSKKFRSRCAYANVKLNDDVGHGIAKTEVDFNGEHYLLTAEGVLYSHTKKTRLKLEATLQLLKKRASFSARRIAAFIGLCIYATYSTSYVLGEWHFVIRFLGAMEQAMNFNGGARNHPGWSCILHIPGDVHRQMIHWVETLLQAAPGKVLTKEAHENAVWEATLYVDASEYGWGAVWCAGGAIRYTANQWTPNERTTYNVGASAVAEPLAVRKAMCFFVGQKELRPGKVTIYCDHQPLVWAVMKGVGRTIGYSQVATLAATYRRSLAIDVGLKWIPGISNPADGLSRGRGYSTFT